MCQAWHPFPSNSTTTLQTRQVPQRSTPVPTLQRSYDVLLHSSHLQMPVLIVLQWQQTSGVHILSGLKLQARIASVTSFLCPCTTIGCHMQGMPSNIFSHLQPHTLHLWKTYFSVLSPTHLARHDGRRDRPIHRTGVAFSRPEHAMAL